MKVQVEAVCDIGCIRENKEDMILIGETLLRNGQQELSLITDKTFLIGVADGMGGHKAGELASELVLRELRQATQMIPPEQNTGMLTSWLNQLIQKIHERLNDYGHRIGFPGLGTTFAGILYYEDRAYIFHVGDSRVYRFRGGIDGAVNQRPQL